MSYKSGKKEYSHIELMQMSTSFGGGGFMTPFET